MDQKKMRRDHKLRIAVGLLRGLCRRYSLMRNDLSQIHVQERDSVTIQRLSAHSGHPLVA